jgi:DNA mismatch repair ATPase MutL
MKRLGRTGAGIGVACLVVVALCRFSNAQEPSNPPQQNQAPAQSQSQSQTPSPTQPQTSPQDQTQVPPPAPQNSSSQSPPSQETQPETPEEKKDESPSPMQQAAEVTKEVGQKTLVKVTDWESGWISGIYVGKNRPLVAMTAEQRKEIYLRQTFTQPSDYMKRMFEALFDQARDSPPQWGGGIGGYSARFASREGQFFAANSIAALGNAKLKYEPRYDQCRCSAFLSRMRHAILRNFLTYNETEKELRPQWALYAGAFSGGVISGAWRPKPRNALRDGGWAVAGQAGYGVALNLFIEFSDDFNRKIRPKR